LLDRVREDGRVEIGRVLHDSMDLEHYLPDDYRNRLADEDRPEKT
jgi:hypothetical protein